MRAGLFKPNCALGNVSFFFLYIYLAIMVYRFLYVVVLLATECTLLIIISTVLIDFMIRLGYLTPDNEPDYMKIITRLHGRFDYERW